MKSLRRLGYRSIGLPLSADDVLEFHAARLLLLLLKCGTSGRQISGLTKMAKLDFFARYPDFFLAARVSFLKETSSVSRTSSNSIDAVESAMIRHHYGPWDKRYYHVLAYLEAKQLITISQSKQSSYCITLSELGLDQAKQIEQLESFTSLGERMTEIKNTFGSKNGTYLKNLIYQLFEREVGNRPMGEVIVK